MKKTIYASFFILFLITNPAIAADRSGCLTCHQFPGLALMTEKGTLKITHINENKFLQSPHKDLGCQDCHVGVTSMPPPEKPKIDCSSSCHQSNAGKIMVKNFPLHKMHEGEKSAVLLIDDKSPCRICHNTYPHSKYKLTRAILNKHTFQLACEVCHLVKNGDDEIIYDWTDAEKATFKGEPFTVYYNPATRALEKSSSTLSRIGIYKMENGEKKPLMKRWDKEKANKLKVAEKDWTPEEAATVMNYLHKNIGKIVIKRACDKCHRKGGLVDFRALGYSDKRADELENMDLKKIVSGYETFHMPTFMKP